MRFTTNKERRKAFLKGAWRSHAALTFFAAAGVSGAAGAAVTAPLFVEGLRAMTTLGRIEDALERSAAASAASRPVLWMALCLTLALLGVFPLLWRRLEAARWPQETLEISGNELRHASRRRDAPDGMFDVLVCRIDRLAFRYDPRSRRLNLWTRDGADAPGMVAATVADADAAAGIPFDDLARAGDNAVPETWLYPWFDPDPVQALRDAGAEELEP